MKDMSAQQVTTRSRSMETPAKSQPSEIGGKVLLGVGHNEELGRVVPAPVGSEAEGPPPLSFAFALEATEDALGSLIRAWSLRQLGRFKEAYRLDDRVESELLAIHKRALRWMEEEVRTSARIRSRQCLPPAIVAAAALPHAQAILARWLPSGKLVAGFWSVGACEPWPEGGEVGLATGAWIERSGRTYGEDLVSLAQFLFDLDRVEATNRVAGMIGMGGSVRGDGSRRETR